MRKDYSSSGHYHSNRFNNESVVNINNTSKLNTYKGGNSNNNNNMYKALGSSSSNINLSRSKIQNINLSRLSMSKGKFSLTSKYNTNVNCYNNNNYCQQQYQYNQNQNNKQNNYKLSNQHFKDINKTKCNNGDLVKNYQGLIKNDSKVHINTLLNQNISHNNNKSNNNKLYNTQKQKPFAKKQQNRHITDKQQQHDIQSFKINQIRDIAYNTHILKNKNRQQTLQDQLIRNIKDTNNNKDMSLKNSISQINYKRRSKFHKYDNINNSNEFLFIEQGNGQIITINQKSKLQNKVKQNNNKLINKEEKIKNVMDRKQKQRQLNKQKIGNDFQQIRKGYQCEMNQKQELVKQLRGQLAQCKGQVQQLRQSIVQCNQQIQLREQQLKGYRMSMREISYSMIRMISIMTKWESTIPTTTIIKKKNTKNMKQNNDNNSSTENDNGINNDGLVYMRVLKREISSLYNKELIHYIDKLHIRQQLIKLAKKESLLSDINKDKYKQEDKFNNNNRDNKDHEQSEGECTFIEEYDCVIGDQNNSNNNISGLNDEQNRHNNRQTISQQHSHYHHRNTQSQVVSNNTFNQSVDSLHQYQLRSVYNNNKKQQYNNESKQSYPYNQQSQSQQNIDFKQYNNESKQSYPYNQQSQQNIDFSNFDQFNKINNLQLQLIGSGRNLLDTFNHQHLAEQLHQINNNNHNHNEYQINQLSNNYEGDYNEKQSQYQEHSYQKQHSEINNDTPYSDMSNRQLLAQNLQQAMNVNNQQQFNICRKLFNDNNQEETQSKQQTIKQKINTEQHDISITNKTQYTKQHLSLSPLNKNNNDLNNNNQQPLPNNYYKLIKPITYNQQQTTTNYLQISTNFIFKLLRKVDSNRWIAESNDKIGFLLHSTIKNNIIKVKQYNTTTKNYHQNQTSPST